MMVLSSAEHDDLIRRVERLVRHRGLDRSVIAGAVDRVLGGLRTASFEPAGTHMMVVTAESMPDLASRLRRAVPPDIALGDVGVASAGRHTVVTARVRASEVAALRQAAERVGAHVVVREQVA